MKRRIAELHPFTVLCLAVLTVSVATAASRWWLSCAVIVLCLAIGAVAGKARKLAALSGAIMLPTFLSLLMIHGLASQDSSAVIAAWGPVSLTLGGVEIAMALALRTAVLVVAGLLCGVLIDKHQLVAAIDLSPAPPQAGYLLASTLFLFPQMMEKQHAIGQAQALRKAGTGRGLAGWLQRLRLRAVPLVLSSVQDAHDRSVHLAARGFPARGEHSRLRHVADSQIQRGVRWVALLCSVLAPVAILVPLGGAS